MADHNATGGAAQRRSLPKICEAHLCEKHAEYEVTGLPGRSAVLCFDHKEYVLLVARVFGCDTTVRLLSSKER
jgi:hypothetical protein